MRKILKCIKFFCFSIIGTIILYLSGASVGSLIIVNKNFKQTCDGISIFVSTNGVHTYLILPISADSKDWHQFVPLSDFPPDCIRSQFISFGWGDKEFYMNTPEWKDIRFKTLVRAAIPSETAISVRYLDYQPEESKKMSKLIISSNQYAVLTTYILSSFQLDSVGNIIKSQKNPQHFEQFYNAFGNYSVFYTCNNWTADGMKKSGIKAPLWSPFDKGIMYVLKQKFISQKST